jgi:hypothetical protein
MQLTHRPSDTVRTQPLILNLALILTLVGVTALTLDTGVQLKSWTQQFQQTIVQGAGNYVQR